MRRMLTEPKTALAGVKLEASFATFRVSMSTFSAERTRSRAFGRWELVAMIETQGSREKAVWRAGCEERPGPYWVFIGVHPVILRLVQPDQYGEEVSDSRP